LKSRATKVNTDWQDIESRLVERMDELVTGFLKNEEHRINIYPKKNTIDLKRNFERKMEAVNRKTDKAIVMLTRRLLGRSLGKGEEGEEEEEDGDGL
jgi:hypothetical protein